MHIDDVAVYNRALTEIERTSLYEAVDPFYSFDVNLAASSRPAWHFHDYRDSGRWRAR